MNSTRHLASSFHSQELNQSDVLKGSLVLTLRLTLIFTLKKRESLSFIVLDWACLHNKLESMFMLIWNFTFTILNENFCSLCHKKVSLIQFSLNSSFKAFPNSKSSDSLDSNLFGVRAREQSKMSAFFMTEKLDYGFHGFSWKISICFSYRCG